MKKLMLGLLFIGAISCANSEDPSEKFCEETNLICMDYEGASIKIFNNLLSSYQDCTASADCSLKEFILTCENGSTFSTCPAAVATLKASDLENDWHKGAESLCAELRDCNMTCIARASCTDRSANCVAGRCVAE